MPIKKEVCSTGIEELDSKMSGGIPLGSTVLVTGCSGSGKTTLCMQYLFHGAKKGERVFHDHRAAVQAHEEP